MVCTNGFLVAMTNSEFDISDGVKRMEYRAWNGVKIEKFRNMRIGLCLTSSSSAEEKPHEIIHGEFYVPVGFTLDAKKLSSSLSKADGSYSFAIRNDDSVIFARDALGTKPLYYAYEQNSYIALSTDARALAVYGMQPSSIIPGVLYKASLRKLNRINFSPIRYETKNYDAKEAVETITELLTSAVRSRLKDRKVLLGLGGGIDSSLVGELAKEHDITAVTVCTQDSADNKLGRETADLLDLPHETVLVDESTIRSALKHLQQTMYLKNAMHASIACAVHILASQTLKRRRNALVLGQLADELFGGYARYIKYLRSSVQKVREAMFNDVRNAFQDNFERDEAASSSYTNLLLPYASLDLVKYAVTVPLKMKINKGGARKIILREVGKNLDLPEALLKREKKAMQFSSGIYKVVSKMRLSI